MSGPNPPGPESEELEPRVEPSEGDSEFEEGGGEFGEELTGEGTEQGADSDQTDIHSRAYSAPESEHVTSGPYVPADLDLYDYDRYDELADEDATAPRWPWIVGIALWLPWLIVAGVVFVLSSAAGLVFEYYLGPEKH